MTARGLIKKALQEKGFKVTNKTSQSKYTRRMAETDDTGIRVERSLYNKGTLKIEWILIYTNDFIDKEDMRALADNAVKDYNVNTKIIIF